MVAWPPLISTAAWLCVALAAHASQAQTFDAATLREPIDLAATWLVHAGDDLAYAQPDFDDSQWMKFDSTKDMRDLFPHDHAEIVWYRLRLKVAPNQVGVAMKESYLCSAFEIYTNGVLLLHLGRVKPFIPYTSGVSLIERIPDTQIATGSVVIAIRVRLTPTDWSNPLPGLAAQNLTLGQEKELREHFWLPLIGDNAGYFMNTFFSFGLGIVALTLYIAQRGHREYLWIFLQFFTSTLRSISVGQYNNLPEKWLFVDSLVQVAGSLFVILMYFAFLGLRFDRRMRILFTVAAIPLVAVHLAGNNVPAMYDLMAQLPLYLLTFAATPVLLVVHLRRGNREAGLLLIPAILWGLAIISGATLSFLSQIPSLSTMAAQISSFLFASQIGPFRLNFRDLCQLLYLVCLTIIIVSRSTRMSRKQGLYEGQLEAARQVQQVILPEQVETVSGFTVESVYQPAQQVGGDFFQVLPTGDGGMLMVVGDVAGKGLPAAMLVSLLVGAIRTVADYTNAPDEILSKLNERLLGRTHGGFSTALAAHITADGQVTIANAGHLSPYLDGQEIELSGALPLGIVSGVAYETTQFHLASGCRLTFYSDGVVEAQNPCGELFGFDRAKAISTQPAAAIAEAAKQFGQEDDITVITIERLEAGEESTSIGIAPILAPA